jgi:ABC-type branched-subunit amino acid transport system substrate-binding protein
MQTTDGWATMAHRNHRNHRNHRLLGTAVVAVVAALLTACSSTNSSAPTTSAPSGSGSGSSSGSSIPSSAFTDTTGLTSNSVRIGNVSTLEFGLFKGADVGTEAWADYIDSKGGINGRTLVVDSGDDQYAGAPNKQLTEQDIQKDFAMVGGFSLQDSFGATVLAANPQVPNVTVSLSPAANDLPNTFSPNPAVGGWQLGPLAYFKTKFPADITHTGALIADQPSATDKWTAEKAAMGSLGYKVLYDPTYDITQTDFNQNVIVMKDDGVKILFLEQMPENYAASVVKALNQQDFHPVLVLGGSTYSEELVPDSGGASAIDGAYMEQGNPLYLGEDAPDIPAVSTFLTWVQKASPGFHPDLYTLYGWLSGELFSEALQAAGPHPTRGSVLRQLSKITSFTGQGLIARNDPAAKTPGSCYVISRIVDGRYQRLDDPPVDGPTQGFRCDQPYYYYPPRSST